MKKLTKEQLIELRREHVPPEDADKIQEQLKRIYKKEYIPQHTPEEYFKLIRDWDVDAPEEVHPQDTNDAEFIYECFSEVSQHVSGYTKEHCYDQIWDAVQEKKKRIRGYKKLPTLKELVESNLIINPTETYYYKEKGSCPDSKDGCDGASILRMREIGIDNYNKEKSREWWEYVFKGLTEKNISDIKKSLDKFA
jgi:hypothetical protein